MVGTIDGGLSANVFVGATDFVGGNTPWAGFVPIGQDKVPVNDDSRDLLLTSLAGGSTINSNANSAGVGGGGGGQDIGVNEGIRLDYVVDLTGDPKKMTPRLTATTWSMAPLFCLVALPAHRRHCSKPPTTPMGTRSSAMDLQFPLQASESCSGGQRVFVDLASVTDPFSVSVGGQTFTIDQQPGGSVVVDGIVDNTAIVISTANGFNSLAITYESGDAFALTGVGNAVFDPGAQVKFGVPVELVDADGDATTAPQPDAVARGSVRTAGTRSRRQ